MQLRRSGRFYRRRAARCTAAAFTAVYATAEQYQQPLAGVLEKSPPETRNQSDDTFCT